MRTKTVKRHYCDFCGRGMFRKPDMERHEKGCTKNAARNCYLCENGSNSIDEMAALAAALREENSNNSPEDFTASDDELKRIRTAADNCPLCILSILRQSGLFAFESFDYKAEREEWDKSAIIEQYGSLTTDF